MASEDIRTTLQFQADIGDFKAAMQEANRAISLANSEFAAASSGMDDWAGSTDGLTAKIKQLTTVQAAQQRKLDVLKQQYAQVAAEQGEGSRAAQELMVKINNQQAVVNKTGKEIKKYTGQLNDAGEETEELASASEEAKGGFEGLEKAGGALTAAMAAVGAAVVGAVTSFFAAAEGTREYRREMAQMAQNAAGAGHDMDAMKETLADVASVTGEADAAMEGLNMLMATGLDTKQLELAADAFAGAATKFDGLKFEGLAEGLQESLAVGQAVGPFAELIERTGGNLEAFNAGLAACTTEAERQQYVMSWLASSGLTEVHDAYVKNNADLVNAEKAQFRLNDAMAQLGAIAEPVMTSLKNMAADLLTAITPFVALIGEGLTGALNGSSTAAGALTEGISGLLTSLVGKVTETVPLLLEVITGILPELITTVTEALPTVVDAILQVVPQLITALLGVLPTLISGLLGMVSQIVTSLSAALPQVVEAIVAVVPQIITSLVQSVPALLEAATTLLMAIVEALPTIVEALTAALPQLITTITTYLSESIETLLEAAIELLMASVEALPTIIDALVEALPGVIEAVVDFFTQNIDVILEAAIELLMAIVEALPTIIEALVKAMPRIISTIIEALVKAVPKMLSTAADLFGQLLKAAGELLFKIPTMMADIVLALLKGLGAGIAGAARVAGSIVSAIWETIVSLPGKMLDIGKNIVSGLWEGLKGSIGWIKDKITGWVGDVLGFLKGLFGINSPSTETAWQGEMLVEGYVQSLLAGRKQVASASKKLHDVALGGLENPVAGVGASAAGGRTIVFNQTNNSPRALSRRDIYRQTYNALAYAGGV